MSDQAAQTSGAKRCIPEPDSASAQKRGRSDDPPPDPEPTEAQEEEEPYGAEDFFNHTCALNKYDPEMVKVTPREGNPYTFTVGGITENFVTIHNDPLPGGCPRVCITHGKETEISLRVYELMSSKKIHPMEQPKNNPNVSENTMTHYLYPSYLTWNLKGRELELADLLLDSIVEALMEI